MTQDEEVTTSKEISRSRRRYGVNHVDRYAVGITETITYKMYGGNRVVLDLITDSQNFLAEGDLNNVRKTLNIAKHLLSEIANGKLVATKNAKIKKHD